MPVESNKSTRKKTKITPIKLAVNRFSKFICINVGAIEGTVPMTPLNSFKPNAVAMPVITKILMIIAPRTLNWCITTIIKKPNNVNNTVGFLRSPKPTSVAGLSTIMPEFFKATKARNKPIPPPMANFNDIGIALTMASRILNILIAIKIKPDTKTAAKAVCHGTPIPKHTE